MYAMKRIIIDEDDESQNIKNMNEVLIINI